MTSSSSISSEPCQVVASDKILIAAHDEICVAGMEALVDPTDAELFLRDNYRLACQASIALDNVDIEFAPLRRRPRILEPEPRKTDT